MAIICLDMSWISHCGIEIIRLLISRLGAGNSRLGHTIRMTMGSPVIVGVMQEANKFSFLLFLKGYFAFVL